MTQFRDSMNTDPIVDDKVCQTSHIEQKFSFLQAMFHPLDLTLNWTLFHVLDKLSWRRLLNLRDQKNVVLKGLKITTV